MNITSLFPAISDTDYHSDRGSLSSTGARKILDCPARFKWERDNPPPPRRAFDLGHVVHAMVLGEGRDIVVVDAADWRTKDSQAQRQAAYDSDRVPLLRSEYEAAVAMRDSVRAHNAAAELLSDGIAERSGYWIDEPTKVKLRFRPDWLTMIVDRVVCVDLKTTVSANPSEFARSVMKYGYHIQQKWYETGLAANGLGDCAFYFVLVEKTPPYPVSVVELDREAVEHGGLLMRRAIDTYARCVDADDWPAYGSGIHSVSLPPWAVRESVNADAAALIAELESL